MQTAGCLFAGPRSVFPSPAQPGGAIPRMKFPRLPFLLLTLLGCLYGARVDASWLTHHSSVILMSGLAGDLESETEYQAQMHSWLELLAGQSFAGSVTVLSDSAVENPPAGLRLVMHKASRDECLGLTLEESTNPPLVVVWGHGGMQGEKPVFHVRGPRMTAKDFESLATKFKGGSDWVLYFRGSGQFSRSLDAPGRRILSSEAEAAYSSDPIGMSLLLKLLGSDDAGDFQTIARSLGSSVAQWYAGRNLARTEQPAWWAGDGAPKILATEEKSATAATNTAASSTTNLPPAWKDIRAVEPRRFPDEDAVILSRNVNCTLAGRPALSMEQEEFIQILTAEGKRLADFDFQYAPPDQDIRFIDCEVLKPDGTLIRLNPEFIHETESSGSGGAHRKIFSLPQAGPGAILHVRVQTLWQSFPLPHVSTQIPLDSEIPILRETVRASVPKGDAFHFAIEATESRDPELKQTEYGTSYLWQFENRPARSREVLVPPNLEPRLLISTFPDWASFTEWYGRICKLSDEITPAISSKAAEIVRGAATDDEKIEAVFRFVTSLRYVAVEMGVNSFRPHAADHVLQNQYGDCKDKANLFNTLLRALKIDGLTADLVLVPRFSQANDQTPGLAFNHAIARVVLRGVTNWVDTTDDVCRFGMLPPGDPGRKVLVIDGHATALTPLPSPLARDHWLSLRAQVTGTNGEATLNIDATAAGFPDYELRSHAREIKKHATNSPLLASAFRLSNGSFSLKTQEFSDIAALHTNFNVQLDGDLIGAMLPGAEGRAVLRAPFWLPREWEAALHQRTMPLFLNQGYPLKLDETIEWNLPGAALIAKPVLENPTGPLSWKVEWKQDGPRLLTRLLVELACGEVADFSLLQKQLRSLLAAVGAGADCTIAADKHTTP